ncbi:MAG: hypothetical protein GY698_04640 [Actinomycetia bacterium]|nr:hypothetical protein [Actinomycetes bacterium]
MSCSSGRSGEAEPPITTLPALTWDVLDVARGSVSRDFYLHHDPELECFYLASDDPAVVERRYRAFIGDGWTVTKEPLQILKADGSIYAAEGDRIVTDDYDMAWENQPEFRCGSAHDLWLGFGDHVFVEGTTDLRPRSPG